LAGRIFKGIDHEHHYENPNLRPAWPHGAGWGCFPSGGLGLVLTIVVVLMLVGRIWV
jgi:hypothetical protein